MFNLRVWGPQACFTQPPLKAERVSYPVITPSAAQGILDSVYRGDNMFWGIHQLYVLKPIRYQSLKQNEINCRARPSQPFINTGDMDNRVQRTSEILYDVEYVIRAEIYPKDDTNQTACFYNKHQAMFTRYATVGRHWQRPCLGIREYLAYYELVPDAELSMYAERAKALGDVDFGMMLCTRDYDSADKSAIFYHAVMKDGIINVPCNSRGRYDATKQIAVPCTS